MMVVAEDHKRLSDADRGANTGGMGAYAPAALRTLALLRAGRHIVQRPAVLQAPRGNMIIFRGRALRRDDAECRRAKGGPELQLPPWYPETQAILPLLDSDLR